MKTDQRASEIFVLPKLSFKPSNSLEPQSLNKRGSIEELTRYVDSIHQISDVKKNNVVVGIEKKFSSIFHEKGRDSVGSLGAISSSARNSVNMERGSIERRNRLSSFDDWSREKSGCLHVIASESTLQNQGLLDLSTRQKAKSLVLKW